VSVYIAPNCPELLVQMDFTNLPTGSTRTWTDISKYVRSLVYQRAGRNSELQRTEPGTLQMALDNRDGRFDPTNTTSPYYPNVKRMRWLRVTAVWAGTSYIRWTGLVEGWSQSWPEAGKDATTTVSAVDAMKVLNLFDLVGWSAAAQVSSDRFTALITQVWGYNAGNVLTAGASTIVEALPFPEGSSALAYLQEVEATENGLIYAEADGTVTFQGRHHRYSNFFSNTARGTIGEGPNEIPYRAPGEYSFDDSFLYNQAIVTPSGGSAQTATDATSITQHWERTVTRQLLTSDAEEAITCAQYLVMKYADPSPRIPKVELVPQGASVAYRSTAWTKILQTINSDRYIWERAAVKPITTEVYVERVLEAVIPGSEWRIQFELSPAEDTDGWILEHSTFGRAGVTTRVVY